MGNSSGCAGGIYPRVLFPGRGACSVFSVYHSRKSARPVNRRVNSSAASWAPPEKYLNEKCLQSEERCCREATNLNTHPAPAVPALSRCRVTPSQFCILLDIEISIPSQLNVKESRPADRGVLEVEDLCLNPWANWWFDCVMCII